MLFTGMPAMRYYVAKRSAIGETPVPIKGKKEFEAKCLKGAGILAQLTNGIDYEDFATSEEAIQWVAKNEIPEEDRVVSPKSTKEKMVGLQFFGGLAVIIVSVIAFALLQQWYYENCLHGWKIHLTFYDILFSPTCRFYQKSLVTANDWVVQLAVGFCSSFGIYIYNPFMRAWREYTCYDDAILAQRFSDE